MRYPARISEACPDVGDPIAKSKRVEDDCLFLLQCMRFNVLEENLRSVGEE